MKQTRTLLSHCLRSSLLLLAMAGVSGAEPVINSLSGELVHNGSVTINGGNYGARVSAGPLRHDTFESGTPGATLTGWDFVQGYIYPMYSQEVVRTGSTMSAKVPFPDSLLYQGQTVSVNGCSFGIRNTLIPKVFIDVWYYYDANYPYSRNHKLFRIHSDNYNPNLYYNVYCGDTGGVLLQDIPNMTLTDISAGKVNVQTRGSKYFAKQWRHIQAYFEESSPGMFNGTAEMWIDGVKIADRINSFWNHEPGDTSRWNTIWFGNFLGHDAVGGCQPYSDANTYWDDVYIDSTRARVEVCDSDHWATREHCETQIPQTWSDSAITVKLNKGSFADFKRQLYLYVVDVNGAANVSGFKLCAECPAEPRNLR